SRLNPPSGDIVKRLPVSDPLVEKNSQIGFLFVFLISGAQIWRIATDVGLPSFVLEVNFSLIEWRAKQVISLYLHAGAGWWAYTEPVQPQRVAADNPVF